MDDGWENPDNAAIFPDDRSGHPYRVWDSIHAAPEILEACLSSDLIDRAACAAEEIQKRNIKKIIYSGTGSSFCVSIYGNKSCAETTGLMSKEITSFELAKYPHPYLDEKTALIGLSHSGNTEVLLQSIEKAKSSGAYIVGITDVPESSLAEISDVALIGSGGRGMLIPSTRSVLSEMLGVLVLNLSIAELRSPGTWKRWDEELFKIPQYVNDAVHISDKYIPDIAYRLKDLDAFYVIGTGPNCATIADAALKLQEISWKPGLAYQAEEAIHGPLLSVGENAGQVLVAAEGNGYERVQRIARGMNMLKMPVFSITYPGADIADYSSESIMIPGNLQELISPFVYLIPLFEFAYWISVHNGHNPDRLRLEENNRMEAYKLLSQHGTK